MLDLTRNYEDRSRGYVYYDSWRYPECRERVDALSKGIFGLDKVFCDKLDELNRSVYDARDDDEVCPGIDANNLFDVSCCPCMHCARCELLDFVEGHSEETVGNGPELLLDFHIEELANYDPKVIKLMPPKVRIYLLELYDRYRAVEIQVRMAEDINNPDCTAGLGGLKTAEEATKKGFWSAFNLAYIYTKDTRWYGRAYPEAEIEAAYERFQYEERKRLGEPVIFYNGRCWFEGFVAAHGYRPGAFPGLDLYIKDEKRVDPQQFAQWLNDKKIERQLSNLPLVGFLGLPVCGVHAVDLFKYYLKWHNCTGSATMRLFPYDKHLEF